MNNEKLKKSILFLSILFILIGSYLGLIYLHPDLVDEAYYRFTTPRASSLIIGTSRSAVGIVPSVLNQNLFNGERRIINHSFSFGTSNYGPRYLKEIENKIQKNNDHNGVFIVSVDPWSLSIGKNDSDAVHSFTEIQKNVFVGGLNSSSINPNFEYLNKYWGNRITPLIEIFKRSINYKNLWVLKEDGWIEITVPCDSVSIKHRTFMGLSQYQKSNMKISKVRLYYLEQILKYLKAEGSVYMIRMPVTSDMQKFEFQMFPEFDSMMKDISGRHDISYFNFIYHNDYSFVDVHHMQKESAFKISQQICDSINYAKRLTHY